jgi:hypothetical protein
MCKEDSQGRRHGLRLIELLLTGSGGSISQMLYTTAGATGINYAARLWELDRERARVGKRIK